MNVRQVAVLMISVYLRDDRMTALREAELRCPPQELIVPFLERGVPLPRDRYVPQAGATTWSHARCHFFCAPSDKHWSSLTQVLNLIHLLDTCISEWTPADMHLTRGFLQGDLPKLGRPSRD